MNFFRPRCTYTIVLLVDHVAKHARDLGHSLDADDTLDGKVSLVSEGACKVVRANLVSGNKSLCNEIAGPLVKQVGLPLVRHTTQPALGCAHIASDDRSVLGFLSVAQRHDEHVATFYLTREWTRIEIHEGVSPSSGMSSALPSLCPIALGYVEPIHIRVRCCLRRKNLTEVMDRVSSRPLSSRLILK